MSTGSRQASDLLHLAPGLKIDADLFAGSRTALVGQSGSGKSYTTRVLAEELLDAHVQTIILDPTGVSWGLRSSADGSQRGLPIPVFGGDHGDVPLEASAGRLMADLVVEEGLSMILDLSRIGTRKQERLFATEFFDRLYRTNRELIHVLIDEADLLAPQTPSKDDMQLLETMETVVRRGRNHGIGVTMATQRPAVLSKSVLSQVSALIALRLISSHDQAAIRAWVEPSGRTEWATMAESLPSLRDGEAWWWVPTLGILKKARARKTRTFDSSPTRRRGDRRREPKTFADVDLGAISDRIAATVQRAKAEDPRELRNRIAELEQELAAAKETAQLPPALDDATVAKLEASASAFASNAESLTNLSDDLITKINLLVGDVSRDADTARHTAAEISNALKEHREPTRRHSTSKTEPSQPTRNTPPLSRALRPAAHETRNPDKSTTLAEVPPARQKLLDAIGTLEAIGIPAPQRSQVALWAGVRPTTGSFANNLSHLRTAGLIDYPDPGTVTLTREGDKITRPAVDPAGITVEAFHERIQGILPPAQWRILRTLIDAYPRAVRRADVAEQLDIRATTGSFANNLSKLRTLGLVDYPSTGEAIAADILFLQR